MPIKSKNGIVTITNPVGSPGMLDNVDVNPINAAKGNFSTLTATTGTVTTLTATTATITTTTGAVNGAVNGTVGATTPAAGTFTTLTGTTVAGGMIATDGETLTGTATDHLVTPANVTARFASPPALGGTTPAAITGTYIASTKYYWCDDFDDEAATVQLESALNADFWTTAGTNYAAANVTYTAGVGGTLKALCANADNDSVTILGLLNYNTTNNPVLEARIKIDTKETAAFLVGFAGAASAAIDTYPENCFLVGINSDNAHTFGATQIVAFSNDDNAGIVYGDCGAAIVSNTYVIIKIDLTDTEQPRVWINGTEVAAANITGTVKDATALAPYIAVQNLAGGAIQRFVTVDYVKCWQDRG